MADHEHHVNLLGLDGRVVVVSGAGGGGIGTTVTTMTARAGATVIAVSRSKENLDEHIAPLAQQGLAVVPVAADASTASLHLDSLVSPRMISRCHARLTRDAHARWAVHDCK